ncbi:MAG: formylglycine-generating enzyme family protein, partial [Kiritimatiellae bacterium]|nr:formylglycine-generating enzyme family protein [Kiritimatiellia bacterium]
FTPDAAGTYWFVFELSEGEGFGAWSVEAFGDEPVPGGDAFVFGGDSEGVVGQPVAFTAVPTAEGAEAVLASFECPEGSGLGKDALEIDWPQVGFTPDAEGEYRFVFMYAEGRDEYGVWTVTVAPAPAEELRITNMTLRDGTVTLEYVGTAGSVQGTDDATGAADSWATIPGAAIDAENRTATLPQGKRFLRLSSEAPEEEEVTYLVVDLSGGRDADEWPVEEIEGVPQGGWTEEYKTTKLVLRKVPAGTFTMGSPEDELGRNNDETQHQVTISKPFYVGVFEVTQKQWELAMGSNPAAHQGDARPVESVSYEDIRGLKLGSMWPEEGDVDNHAFLGVLRDKTGLAFDLPTEAQWEYACRAGTATALNSGKNLTDEDRCPEMDEVGRYWYNGGTNGGTIGRHATAGSYAPNAWGLYDMHGNVAEWCLDWFAWQGEEAATDPVGEADGDYRSYRGGSWNGYAQHCRSASRNCGSPSHSHDSLGLRLVCPVPEEEEERTGVQLWEGGPFWAETNLGAEKPEDAGLYFWWGDTVGYRREGDAWVASDGASTNFSFTEANTPTYGKDVNELWSTG